MAVKTREVSRDERDYDTTQLHMAGHGRTLHRDYSAHFFRWSFARRFITCEDDVLEVGCGEEKPLSKILTGGTAPCVKNYVGVDLNKLKPSNAKRLTFHGEFNFVERYKELLKEHGGVGFDVLVHFEVIEHINVELGKKFLKAAYECLKPGGVMLMSTPCYDGVRHAANHIHEYTVPELQAAVEKAGFEVEKRFGTFMDIKHIGKVAPDFDPSLQDAVKKLRSALGEYYDNDAMSCFFAPLYCDHSRNNLWVCRKPLTAKKGKK